MSETHYLAVFTSNKTGPQWRVWYEMSDEQKARTAEAGVAAVKAWDAAHADVIVYQGGPLGPTKRTKADGGIEDVVNLLTVFMVVRADSHEAAARIFEDHPHMTIFPCDGVEVMPILSGDETGDAA